VSDSSQTLPSIKKKPELTFSERVEGIPEALSIYINQLVYDQKRKGVDVVTLSLGEAFFDIPVFDFTKLDFVKGYHYSDSQGIPELRQRIAGYYEKHYEAHVNSKDEILITAGSKPVIFMAMQATLNPGDEVLIHEPAWLSYQEQIRLVGGVPRFIPYDCPVSDFDAYFTPKTKMVVFNNPNNPAGRVYSRAELDLIYTQCRSRGAFALVDEAYSDFVVNEEFHSLAKVVPDKDGVIIVNSLSKNMGMSGWRVGYAISSPPVIQNLLKLNQHIITCAPTILLYYMARYFDDVINITLPQVTEVVEKRDRVGAYMKQIGLKPMGGSSTFYYFVSIDPYEGSSMDLSLDLLLTHGIAVVPGSAYGKSTERFVRVSIGTESEERIQEALLTMRDVMHAREYDPIRIAKTLDQSGCRRFDPK
jgi:aspartate aminotransferase/aminotransferase